MKILLASLVCILLLGMQNSFSMTIIAHRGLPKYFPEHTELSLRQALKSNPDFVEPDLVLTKDRVWIVQHDLTLDATSNVKEVFPFRKRGDGKYYVIDFTYEELTKLSFNKRVDPALGKPRIKTRLRSKDQNQGVLSCIDEVFYKIFILI